MKARGFKISSGTWTRYVKNVGMVLSEELERERRDPDNKYRLSQGDETAMGKRKYNQ